MSRAARLTLLGLLVAAPVLSRTPALAQDVADPRVFGDRLLQAFQDSRAEGFLDLLEKESALGEGPTVQVLHDNRAAWTRQLNSGGVPSGWEYGGYLEASPSLRVLCYIAKYRGTPTLFELAFYRAEQSWNLLNAAWSTGQSMWRAACVTGGPHHGVN